MVKSAHILVFPYPAQGHMLPLLDLAHHLSARGLAVTVVVTPKNLPLLDPLIARSPTVDPLVLPFPDHPSLPAGVENAKDLPRHLLPILRLALAGLHHPLLRWARAHPHPPTVVLSDFFLGWTHNLAADLGIPRLVFSPSGALFVSVLHRLWLDLPKPNPGDPDSPVAFPSLPNSPVYPWRHLSIFYRRYREGNRDPVLDSIKDGCLQNLGSWGFVFNTFAGLEGPYLDHLRADLGRPRVWAVGPLTGSLPTSSPAGEVLAWLDRFEEGSVVYVCFGSQAVLSPPQATALATGLERSGARFVWCVRAPSWVPDGFEERVEGRGLVVPGWAPQVAALEHRAVGAFLTHCGWNSVLEGIATGVVMMTWPLSGDQFVNARLVEEAGVAVRACDGGDAVPDPEELAVVVGQSVDRTRPERTRARARELKKKALEAVRGGGSSFRELDGLLNELSNRFT